MRIGELARRSGVSARMLRYDERQGLLRPERSANGYRDFAEADVGRVQQISHLVRVGLATRFVSAVLDMERGPGDGPGPDWSPACTGVFAAELRAELARLEASLACLTRSRDTVRRYLDAVATPRPSGGAGSGD